MSALDKRWTEIAEKMLVGRKIVSVRYLSKEEQGEMGWYHRGVVIQLDDDNVIFPSRDDEGNDAGALFTNDKKYPTLPVIL